MRERWSKLAPSVPVETSRSHHCPLQIRACHPHSPMPPEVPFACHLATRLPHSPITSDKTWLELVLIEAAGLTRLPQPCRVGGPRPRAGPWKLVGWPGKKQPPSPAQPQASDPHWLQQTDSPLHPSTSPPGDCDSQPRRQRGLWGPKSSHKPGHVLVALTANPGGREDHGDPNGLLT